MAWIGDKWHESKSRKKKIETLRKYITPKLSKVKTMSGDDKADLQKYIEEFRRLKAIDLGEENLLFFAYYYFGDNLNKDAVGTWIPEFDSTGLDLKNKPEDIIKFAPNFHHEICDIMNVVSNKEVNKRVCVAAPRSHAKSSFLSKAFPIHELVYRKRSYIILISETPSVSSANLEWIKMQLQSNEKLRRDMGPILHPKQQMNPRDNNSEFIAWEPKGEDGKNMLTLVQAASTGQALRGRNWNGKRPDLIVCDDLEDKRNTNTEQLRQELYDWFTQVVIPLGDPEGKKTAIVFMGTTVHPSALLLKIMNRSDFESKKYQAIITHPKRSDLWEKARQLYTDRENKNNARDAELFYTAHKTEMNEGCTVLWPEVQPIWKLMEFKWNNGSKAFNTELMNDPIDTESAVFVPDNFYYWDERDPYKEFSPRKYEFYMGIDFAMGKERGDYSAITTIARHNETGVAYVVDSYAERVKPNAFLDVIVRKVLHYQPDAIAAEAQMAQEFFVDQLKEALNGTGYPAHTRVRKIKQRTKKELRIEAMLPDIESGKIQFNRRNALLLEQFERYGTNSHDDAIDSLEMALSISKRGKIKLMKKPSYM